MQYVFLIIETKNLLSVIAKDDKQAVSIAKSVYQNRLRHRGLTLHSNFLVYGLKPKNKKYKTYTITDGLTEKS